MYDNLKALTQKNDMFFSSIQTTPSNKPVEIFSYHIASYSDWLEPDAIECRGIMFDITDKENPVILSRPMEKFFNLGENPLALPEDVLPLVKTIEEKRDGSLISTYLDDGKLYTKSKGSLYSDQANDSNRFLMRSENKDFKQALKTLAELGYTANMEYTSPKNQIVLKYEKQELIVLNIRNTETGDYLTLDDLAELDAENPEHTIYTHIAERFVDYEEVDGMSDEDVERIRDMKGIEGYVLVGQNQRVKLKTDWYVNLHRLKDNINNNRRLVESVVESRTDDLRQLFEHDQGSIDKIKEFEQYVLSKIKSCLAEVRTVYERVKHLDRKHYAINAQRYVDYTPLFSVIMRQFDDYNEENVVENIKQIALKNVDDFIPMHYK